MKTVEEMTDSQLAAAFSEFDLHITDDCGERYEAMRADIIRRLQAHPAQRIADLSGCVVTKDINGMWKQWIMWSEGNAPNQSDDGFWCSNVADSIVIKLPDDNRPWQESIYKPQVNVKNGGKDESTSAE